MKDYQIRWKLREGVNLPFAPSQNDSLPQNTVSANTLVQQATPVSSALNSLVSVATQMQQGGQAMSTATPKINAQQANTVANFSTTQAQYPNGQMPNAQGSGVMASANTYQGNQLSVAQNSQGSVGVNTHRSQPQPYMQNNNAFAVNPVNAGAVGQGTNINSPSVYTQIQPQAQVQPQVPAQGQLQPQGYAKVQAQPQPQVQVPSQAQMQAQAQSIANNSMVNANGNNMTKPLRPSDVDLYIDMNDPVSYMPSFLTFLIQKKLSISGYDDRYSYKDSDIVLVKPNTNAPVNAKVFVMTEDKASLWNFLKQHLAGRLLNAR